MHPRVVHPWPAMTAVALLLALVVTQGLGAAGLLGGLVTAAGGTWWVQWSAARQRCASASALPTSSPWAGPPSSSA